MLSGMTKTIYDVIGDVEERGHSPGLTKGMNAIQCFVTYDTREVARNARRVEEPAVLEPRFYGACCWGQGRGGKERNGGKVG
jgi:hypothetical protein